MRELVLIMFVFLLAQACFSQADPNDLSTYDGAKRAIIREVRLQGYTVGQAQTIGMVQIARDAGLSGANLKRLHQYHQNLRREVLADIKRRADLAAVSDFVAYVRQQYADNVWRKIVRYLYLKSEW